MTFLRDFNCIRFSKEKCPNGILWVYSYTKIFKDKYPTFTFIYFFMDFEIEH